MGGEGDQHSSGTALMLGRTDQHEPWEPQAGREGQNKVMDTVKAPWGGHSTLRILPASDPQVLSFQTCGTRKGWNPTSQAHTRERASYTETLLLIGAGCH